MRARWRRSGGRRHDDPLAVAAAPTNRLGDGDHRGPLSEREGVVVAVALTLLLAQWQPNGGADAPAGPIFLQGSWQTCDGERIWHLGTRRGERFEFHANGSDFAIFRGWHPDADPTGPFPHLDHDGPLNLLHGHDATDPRSVAGRNWTVPELGLHLNVVIAGGSRSECESYWLLLERDRGVSRAASR